MDLIEAFSFVAQHRTGVLVTIRRDGRPQSSNVSYGLREGVVRVSVVDDRAKVRNLERDPRAVLHVTTSDFWSYISLDGTVELSPIASQIGDAVCEELLEVYEEVAGKPHPDRNEFHEAMVRDRRRVIRFHPTSAVGMIPSA